jgi:hypothetical protein
MTVILGGSPAVPNVVAHGRRIRMLDRRVTSTSIATVTLLSLLPGRRRASMPSSMPPTMTSARAVGQLTGRPPAGSSVLGQACNCAYC